MKNGSNGREGIRNNDGERRYNGGSRYNSNRQPSKDADFRGGQRPSGGSSGVRGEERPSGGSSGVRGEERPSGGNSGVRREESGRPSGQNPPGRQPNAGMRPNTGTPPNAGSRPNAGVRPNSGGVPFGRGDNARLQHQKRDDAFRMPPREPQRLEPVGYDRPARFWDVGRHYFGHKIHSLPPRAVRRVYLGVPYYVLDDIYYRFFNDAYYVCRPPYGVGFAETTYDGTPNICSFAYYAGSYYEFSSNSEMATAITSGNARTAASNVAAARARGITLDAYTALKACRFADGLGLVQSFADLSKDYYYSDGVFYTLSSDGRYYTVVPPAGALVRSLPNDSRGVYLNGEEYYAVDDTLYRYVSIAGVNYFEVLGQMAE